MYCIRSSGGEASNCAVASPPGDAGGHRCLTASTQQMFEKGAVLSPKPEAPVKPGSDICAHPTVAWVSVLPLPSRITKPLFPILMLLVQLSLVEERSGGARPSTHGQLFSEYLRHECLFLRQAAGMSGSRGREEFLFVLDIS